MSLKDLDVLASELPQLFQQRQPPATFDDELIIIPVNEPDRGLDSEDTEYEPTNDLPYFDDLTDEGFEEWGAQQVDGQNPVPDLSAEVLESFGGEHAGAPVPYHDRERSPGTDCLAFYLPFHYYHPTWWGVYLLFDGVLWLASDIVRRSGRTVSQKAAFRAARLFLYYHEAFHHKTECFATRLELTHRQSFFQTGFEQLYRRTFGKGDCLEEGLANASALIEVRRNTKDIAIHDALTQFVLDSPPGYDQGERIRLDFRGQRCVFAEENQRECLPTLPHSNPDVWLSASHSFDGIANIKSRVNYVIPKNSPLSRRLPFRPLLPPRKLTKKLKDLAGLEFESHGARHDIYKMPSGKKIPIPRHPRDLGRGLIRSILKEAGVDMSLEEFMRH